MEAASAKRILASTPARLHFGLIDMNGEVGRIDGGLALALQSPHTVIEAQAADDTRAATIAREQHGKVLELRCADHMTNAYKKFTELVQW